MKNSSTPIEIDLMPVNGNPDLEVTLVKNLSVGREYWKEQSKKPMFVSNNSIGMDQMVLDPLINNELRETCSAECVILISVTNPTKLYQIKNVNDKRKYAVHFKIQVSQNFKELISELKI